MTTRRDFVSATIATAFTADLSLAKVTSLSSSAAKPQRPSQWRPESTWVFAVGVLAYPDEGQAWPEAGRRDAAMIEQLRSLGVPAPQITFIRNKDATRRSVEHAFAAFLAKAPADATLWFYFAGHGDKSDDGVGEFLLYDASWPIPRVLALIERHFKGSLGFLFADCCYSGNLCLEAMMRAGRMAYAALTSSLSSAVSTGDWTFTNCLIQALKGQVQVDANGDGMIDFLELASFAEREMAANDGQLSTFVAANGFDPRMVLVPGLPRAHPRIGQYVSAKAKDSRWYPGRIEAAQPGKFFIKWAGYGEDKNEWVAESDIKTLTLQQHPPGTKVSVEWKGKWYPAEVITGRLGMHLIRYDTFAPIWDEWVDIKRLRLAAK